MKTITLVAAFVSALGMMVLGSSCSTFSSKKSSEEISSSGPTVLTAKAEPSTIELDQNLQPKETPLIFADVKDFQSNIQNVRLRFIHVPLDVPMKRAAGTTWQVVLTPIQLRELAVSGQTVRYQANIIATNENGQTGISNAPLEVSITTPEPKQLSGQVPPTQTQNYSGYTSQFQSTNPGQQPGVAGTSTSSSSSAVKKHKKSSDSYSATDSNTNDRSSNESQQP